MGRFELGSGRGADFALAPVADGARYDGPHGPMLIAGDVDHEHATVETGHGQSTIAWSRLSTDDLVLENEGVAVHIAGAMSGRLRRHGRTLQLVGDDGQTLAVLRQRRFGRLRLERADGAEVATWKDYRGRVCDDAELADVVLMLLVMASRVDQRLDRPALTL